MKHRSFILTLTVIIAMSLLIFCSTEAAPEKVWNLKLSIEVPDTAPLCVRGFKPWAEQVEKVTNGRVKVVIYPAGTLCKVGEMLDAVGSGITDLGWAWPGLHEGVAPLSCVSGLPMIFEKAETGSKAIWDLYEKIPAVQAEYKDYKLLSLWSTDAYFFMTNKKPVRNMEDLKGLKIRAANAVTADFVKYLGATPVMLRMPEVYMALQKGTLDGTTAQGEAIQGFRFYEVIKYYTKPGLIPGPHFLIMNLNVWNSMPADVQNQILSVSGGVLGARIGHDVFDVATEEFPQRITQAGAKFEILKLSTEEVNRWRKTAAEPTQKDWVKGLEKKGLPGQMVLDEFKKLVSKYGE
jgi:TRAP-type C4-dicarboxylate transport system substrate-binding protein